MFEKTTGEHLVVLEERERFGLFENFSDQKNFFSQKTSPSEDCFSRVFMV
uniref:Uncharacterized protein n=1 Tax=Marseillevirus sp. TaxID=2809551 RepID=A0AA96IYX8_9VIRU|nr:hypothetical protein MarFTMF_508 [Marseillevirus sp.]